MLYVLSFSAGDNSKVNDRIINILNSSTSIFLQGERGKPGKQGPPGMKGYQVSWTVFLFNVQ